MRYKFEMLRIIFGLFILASFIIFLAFLSSVNNWTVPVNELKAKALKLEEDIVVLENRFFVDEDNDTIGLVAPQGDIVKFGPFTSTNGVGRAIEWTNINSTLSNKLTNITKVYLEDDKKFTVASEEGKSSLLLA